MARGEPVVAGLVSPFAETFAPELDDRSGAPTEGWSSELAELFLGPDSGAEGGFPDEAESPAEKDAVRAGIQSGLRDENTLTNQVFFTRHPDRDGRALDRSEPGFETLRREWLAIRDRLVRPLLAASVDPAVPAPDAASPLAAVATQLPGSGVGYRAIKPDRYGIRETVAALEWVGAAWAERHPDVTFVVGDISRRGGGQLKKHKSHRIGLDADVHLRKGEQRMNTRAADYGATFRPLVQALVELLERNPVLPVKRIGIVDPELRGSTVAQWSGHVQHLHVRFCMPAALRSRLDTAVVGGTPAAHYRCAASEGEGEDGEGAAAAGSFEDEDEYADEADDEFQDESATGDAELSPSVGLAAAPDPMLERFGGSELFGESGDGAAVVPEALAGAADLAADVAEMAETDDLMTAEEDSGLEVTSWSGEDQGEDQVAPPAPVCTVTFSVRTDFAVRGGTGLAFDWRPGEPVRGARVEIVGTGIAAVSNGRGLAHRSRAGLADGDHLARITHTAPDSTTTVGAGPAVADGLATVPSRIYRQLDVRIRVVGGGVDSAWVEPGVVHGGIGNRTRAAVTRNHVPVDWKPVWMRSPMKSGERMRPATDIDTLVVHHTGGPQIGPAVNTFLNSGSPANAHYVVDRDGHVVKTAQDLRRANHAGVSRWGGRLGVSGFSIGIEIVHASGPYPAAQMASLTALLTALRAGYPRIAAHSVVGHSDIATDQATPTLLSNRRSEDPGVEFDWRTLENAGLGMAPRPLAALPSLLSSFFRGAFPGSAVLRTGDRDPSGSTPGVLGGTERPGFTATPIRDLQEDLERIGYSCRPVGGPFGRFDLHTTRAVDRFQRHFFAGSRQALRAGRLGRVDVVTALWIKAVRAGVP